MGNNETTPLRRSQKASESRISETDIILIVSSAIITIFVVFVFVVTIVVVVTVVVVIISP